MDSSQFFISTIAADGPETARAYGLGLEIAEYCTASNLDEAFPEIDAALRDRLSGISRRTFHAPFNELFPCAIDPKARELAQERYRQAIAAARGYNASKVVIHGGFLPYVYYDCWFVEQSIAFWRDFMAEGPDVEICLENVLEPDPSLLCRIVEAVGSPGLRLCLDMGHARVYSKVPLSQWISACAPYLSHFHIHNNPGDWDAHSALYEGVIPISRLLEQTRELCPAATYTLEIQQSLPSVQWLTEQGFLEGYQ